MLFTAGPTDVPPEVLRAMSKRIQNPDLDEDFFSLYDNLCDKIRTVESTKNDLFVLAGEGMVGLDSALASLVERGDKVLAISSGFFGDGFVDMIKNYGGRPTVLKTEYNEVASPNSIDRILEKNKKISIATFVHCETPSGTIAPLDEVGKICNDHGVILIADAVSTLGGTPLNIDKNHVDIALGASQKCFSAPPGLAIISVSDRAWEKIKKKRNIPFYLNLLEWKNSWLGKRVFPYTQSVSDIYGLDRALDLVLKEGLNNVYKRHDVVAKFVRETSEDIGLELYPSLVEISSPTVTALRVPHGIDDFQLRTYMESKFQVMISGSWGKLSGKVIRLGHMGYNAQVPKARIAMSALSKSLASLGFQNSS